MRVLLSVLPLSGALVAAIPARADDADGVLAKMNAAQKSVRSFTMRISSSALGMTGIATVVEQPAIAMHMTMATGPTTIEMYFIDGTLYEHIGAGVPWIRMTLPNFAEMQTLSSTLSKQLHATTAPDVVDAGVTYGAIQVQSNTATIQGAPAVGPTTMTCTYDKTSFLPHGCTNGVMTETLGDYNAPTAPIVLPPDARNARDMTPPATGINGPVPAPVPSPTG